jgi:hypothetical protein
MAKKVKHESMEFSKVLAIIVTSNFNEGEY